MGKVLANVFAARRFWTPGKVAINQIHRHADQSLRSSDPRTQRRGLQYKVQALIYTDRAAC